MAEEKNNYTKSAIKLIECPRDAMQGIAEWIPTEIKIEYLQSLLAVGFDTLDFGSFVSHKAVPQMSDTLEVYNALDLSDTETKLLAIIVNVRGAKEAADLDNIHYLGYPFSISETFQRRNTNSTIQESLERVQQIQEICKSKEKELVIYISMGFGNPYGDSWNAAIVIQWVDRLYDMGIRIISLSDTIGVSTVESIGYLFSNLIPNHPDIEFGAHLHTLPNSWHEKIQAAYDSGCNRFDGALKGYGGCPMARDELTGNMPMEKIISFLSQKEELPINMKNLAKSLDLTTKVFLH